jgi:multimeric flavodoxin WrbA
MLDIAMQAADQTGYTVKFCDLYQQNIAWCTGCMGCKKTGICVIHDDIDRIREDLLSCDLVITTSPTYFANVPVPLKNLFDRLTGAVMDDNNSAIPKPRLSPKQKYLLLVTCNTPFPLDRLGGQSTGTLRNMKEFFHISGMKCMGKVVYAGTRGKTQVPERIRRRIARLFLQKNIRI